MPISAVAPGTSVSPPFGVAGWLVPAVTTFPLPNQNETTRHWTVVVTLAAVTTLAVAFARSTCELACGAPTTTPASSIQLTVTSSPWFVFSGPQTALAAKPVFVFAAIVRRNTPAKLSGNPAYAVLLIDV